jgi:catechol 2,3-dioxygenase-like lactoylglutathione lyase family enzyme
MRSLFPDVCSDRLEASRDFYVALFGFRVVFEAPDWYVQMQSPADPNLQLAFVRRDHESVPEGFRDAPRGVLVTIETEDVDAVHRRALELGLAPAYALRSEPWGQRHFMVTDPNGLLVDVVQLIPADPEFLAAHGAQAHPG